MIAVIGLSLAFAYAVFLAGCFAQGFWILDPQGHPIANDFVGIWSAGRLALDHHPAAVYDWAIHGKIEELTVGHHLDTFYPWLYPPTFLFAATLIAAIPIAPASVAWLALTLPAYAAAFLGSSMFRVGVFTPLGTALGALYLQVVGTGLTILNLTGPVVQMIQGGILVAAVLVSRLTRPDEH